MKLMIFALRDRIGDTFRTINFNQSDALEKRDVAFSVNNDPHLAFMAKDLELCHIGDIDNKTGQIFPVSPIRVVVRLDQLVGLDDDRRVIKDEI